MLRQASDTAVGLRQRQESDRQRLLETYEQVQGRDRQHFPAADGPRRGVEGRRLTVRGC